MRPCVPQRVALADPDLLGRVLESASWILPSNLPRGQGTDAELADYLRSSPRGAPPTARRWPKR